MVVRLKNNNWIFIIFYILELILSRLDLMLKMKIIKNIKGLEENVSRIFIIIRWVGNYKRKD